MKRTVKLLLPLILLILLIPFNQLLYSQTNVELESYSKLKGKIILASKPGESVQIVHDSSGIAVCLINNGTGFLAVANQVFEKYNTNKISVYITNDETDQNKFIFSETSVSLEDTETYFNLGKYLDKNGTGKFRLVLDKALNKVFVLTKNDQQQN
jgi:hypothetical protein